MSAADRRRRVLEAALFSPNLSYAEKVFMVVVITIKAEYVGGERRHGSKAMGPDGKFALHLDYLAAALAASPNAVRKLRQSLERKSFLTPVHEGTFGRPPTWQAQTIRGAKNGRVTGGEIGTPYGLGDWLIRVADSAPLTYKAPADRNQAPTSGASPEVPLEVEAARKRRSAHPVAASVTACPWHESGIGAPEDCACTTEARRRTA
jgi:hypothetical protein